MDPAAAATNAVTGVAAHHDPQNNAASPALFTEETPNQDVEYLIAHPLVSKMDRSMLDLRTGAMLATVSRFNRTRFADYALRIFTMRLLASLFLPFGKGFFINRAIVYCRKTATGQAVRRTWVATTYLLRAAIRLVVFPTSVAALTAFLWYVPSLTQQAHPTCGGLYFCPFFMFTAALVSAGFACAAFALTVPIRLYIRNSTRWSHRPTSPSSVKPHQLPPVAAFADPRAMALLRERLDYFDVFDLVTKVIPRCVAYMYNTAAAVCADSAPDSTVVDISAAATLDLFYISATILFGFVDIFITNLCIYILDWLFGRPNTRALFSGAATGCLVLIWLVYPSFLKNYIKRARLRFGRLDGDVSARDDFFTNAGDDWVVYFALRWQITCRRVFARPWMRDPLNLSRIESSSIWRLAVICERLLFVAHLAASLWSLPSNGSRVDLAYAALNIPLQLCLTFEFASIALWICAFLANFARFHVWFPLRWILSTKHRNTCPVQ